MYVQHLSSQGHVFWRECERDHMIKCMAQCMHYQDEACDVECESNQVITSWLSGGSLHGKQIEINLLPPFLTV